MEFTLPVYHEPDFSDTKFIEAPDVTTATVTTAGIAPEQYHSTSMYPEYFKIQGEWKLAEESRMDCCVTLDKDMKLHVVEFRNLQQGDEVILGRGDDCIDGIYIHTKGFDAQYQPGGNFAFRIGRSRETAFSQDYDTLYNLLMYERDHGNILWVMGPACTFDSDARECMSYLIENGFVDGILAGNALATHDLEAALYGTALGQDIYSQKPHPKGHYNHLDLLNTVRRCGSMRTFVERYDINNGIVQACIRSDIPMVLTGSIRDDGPLPETIQNSTEGQDAMRDLIRGATTIICMATALHTISTCGMAPCFRVENGKVRPLFIYTVDVSEYAINKLYDRGNLTTTGIVTNVQDFIVMIAKGIQKKLEV